MGHTPLITSSHTSRTVLNSATFLLPHLLPSMSLLDIGCGPGTITVGFFPHLPSGRITGIDSSPSVIALARSLAAPLHLPNVTFQTGDILSLPFPDNTFDVVFAHQLFPHLPHPVAALREVQRVLKPGGIAATCDADTFSWAAKPPRPGPVRAGAGAAAAERGRGVPGGEGDARLGAGGGVFERKNDGRGGRDGV